MKIKLICIRDSGMASLTLGKEYEIEEDKWNKRSIGYGVDVVHDLGYEGCFFPDRFEVSKQYEREKKLKELGL